MSLANDAIYRNKFENKHDTIQQYKRSFLQNSNAYTQVTSLL